MTEEVMAEEAQRTKEYGYIHPRPDDYNEVYDDDGYIEDYPEEDGDDELFLSMDEIEKLRNLSHDKLLSYAIGMAEQYREVKMRVVPSLKKRIEYHEETVQQYGEWLNAAKKYDVDYIMANALTKAWGEVK